MKKRIFLMRPTIEQQELSAIKKVFKSNYLTEDKVTEKFEKKVAHYVKSKYAIATTSATTAIHTALVSMNVKEKYVLVSDFTFPATVLAIKLAGGIPVLMDVNKETMNVTREIVESINTNNVQFLLPVSLFGNPLEKEFYKLKRHGFKIIEDAATNLGTKIGNNYVGPLADLTCFSFHPRKIITTGEGGMITTNNQKLARICRMYKIFGKHNSQFIGDGTNYKLSDILSAIGLIQMKKIEKIIKKRQSMAKIYDELISKIDFIETQLHTKNSRHTYQSYVCFFTRPNLRNKVMKQLSKQNIETQIGTYALHCLPSFKHCLKKGNLSNSEYLYKNTISLPLHNELTIDDQEFICKNIKNSI